ncbi:DNA/RNA nuclease SfsA [Pseudoclostridium thermosuccinogenes]|jgi:sugar fermentation stimulation protein A|uniref:DNA/RNA nuclease SfsA n=1 Tax=Clostridium thermosuccinogenes TaxID=84032 RepID=UPI000CCC6862|nr:DNA/RNA nuclease SfsA [Pseudoclostridium thermosuccinogenes]PNT94258.1 sugar fermentation stimulation protein SfsA [Pseudoclostridium thermosuccinogenes]
MKIEGDLVEARFVKRLNRFVAVVEIDGEQQFTHVPNTGRLRELLTEGATVMVRKYDNPNRSTKFGLILVKRGEIWVSIDSANVPNRIAYELLKQKKFDKFTDYNEIRREVTIGGSRLDFGLFSGSYEYYIEVKGVTLVEDRQAYFPDAPTTRGTRHIEDLIHIKQEGNGAGVIFIIQREDVDVMRPNDRTDRDFGDALRKARQAGVDLDAYACKIDIAERRIDILRQIPVIL